jgi:hAT family C-terminal dimerisation region
MDDDKICDSREYWEIRSKLKRLREISRRIETISPTTCSVERTFSLTGRVSKRKINLNPKKLDKLSFIMNWMNRKE